MSFIPSRTKQILSPIYVVDIGTVLHSHLLQLVMIGARIRSKAYQSVALTWQMMSSTCLCSSVDLWPSSLARLII